MTITKISKNMDEIEETLFLDLEFMKWMELSSLSPNWS